MRERERGGEGGRESLWLITYLIGSTAEPGIPGGAAVPEEVFHAENGVVIIRLLATSAAAAAVMLGIVGSGDNSFLCLPLGRHCSGFSLLPDHQNKHSMRQKKITPLLPRKFLRSKVENKKENPKFHCLKRAYCFDGSLSWTTEISANCEKSWLSQNKNEVRDQISDSWRNSWFEGERERGVVN